MNPERPRFFCLLKLGYLLLYRYTITFVNLIIKTLLVPQFRYDKEAIGEELISKKELWLLNNSIEVKSIQRIS